MKITMQSTTKIVELSGILCRVWEGHTAAGVPCHAFIPRIAVDKDADNAQFESELEEQMAPSEGVATYPLKMIL
jgi:hypothetical protein